MKTLVKVVCIDLSSSYRHVVRQHFPNAKIVADRFHVIRLMHHLCMQTYQEIDPTLKNQRGLLAALRTNPENLTAKRLQKRDEYLKQQPAIESIYQFKQMWRFTKNNGITEGFHRKMKLIQRRAYGFRNFENYRLQVRVLCS